MRGLFLVIVIMLLAMVPRIGAQKPTHPPPPKLEICYFHPTERCPIDQSIEENIKRMMRTDFAKEVAAGTLKYRVINTDDKAFANLVSKFEMNAQALYLVWTENGKEKRKDLTEFAFSTSLANPTKFKAGFHDEVVAILKK